MVSVLHTNLISYRVGLVAFARATLRDKKKKERRGLRETGAENSPISPPLDPRLEHYPKLNNQTQL